MVLNSRVKPALLLLLYFTFIKRPLTRLDQRRYNFHGQGNSTILRQRGQLNRWVFRADLKVESDSLVLIFGGRLFQRTDSALQNARSP